MSVILLAASPAAAQTTRRWDGSDSNNWFAPQNWTSAFVPTTSNPVIIDDSLFAPVGPRIVGGDAFANSVVVTNNSLEVSSLGTLDVLQKITIGAGGAFTAHNSAIVNSGAVFRVLSGGTATFDNATLTAGSVEVGIQAGVSSSLLAVINGAVVDVGTGTVFVGGAADGTLAIGQGGTAGTVNAAAVDLGSAGSKLVFEHTGTTTFAADVTGFGQVQVIGPGTTILTGANTYAGGTTITGGTLQIGNGGTIGSIVGDVVDNATLAIGRSDAFSFGGDISGTGAFQQIGTGTTILTGSNTYTGGTTITAGTLQIGNGGTTGAIAGDVVDNATFAIDRSDAFSFGGIISGTGAFQQIGTGTTTFTGINTYTGATTINAGGLIVNGSIASSILTTVNAGGTLGGTGTVGNTIINGGTLSPGHSIGTFNVQGSLVFTSAASYLVEVSPSTADLTNVTGTATLGGRVQAAFAPGSYAGRQYLILHSAGLGGTTFDGVTSSLPGFAVSLSYTSTDVLLNLTAALGVGAGLNRNQQNVATAINTFFNDGGTLPSGFVAVSGLTGASLGNALAQLSGEATTGAQQGAFQITGQFLGIMLDPFVDGRGGSGAAAGPALGFAPERPAQPDDVVRAYAKAMKSPAITAPTDLQPYWTAWGGAFGGYNHTDGDSAVVGSHDLTARAAGLAAGLDYRVAPGTVLGFALAGGGTNWSLAQGLGGGKSDVFQAGLYAATRVGPAYLAASLAFTNHWMSTDRFAAFGDHLTASFNAQSIGGRVESGYRLGMLAFGVTPYAALQAQGFRTPAYSETDVSGGGFALTYDSHTATDTRSELGARIDHVAMVDPAAVLTLRGRLAWARDWVSDPALTATFQALPGASFIVNGATPAKDTALASAGAELRLANDVTLSAKFDGEFAGNARTYAGTGALRVTW